MNSIIPWLVAVAMIVAVSLLVAKAQNAEARGATTRAIVGMSPFLQLRNAKKSK